MFFRFLKALVDAGLDKYTDLKVNIALRTLFFEYLQAEAGAKYVTDIEPPFLRYRPSPYSGETNVKVNRKIVLKIKDVGWGVDIDTVWVEVDNVKYKKGDSEFAYYGDSSEYIIAVRPSADWGYNKTIVVRVYAEDLAGNPGLLIEQF